MNNSLIQLLFALLRSVICGNQMSEQEKSLYSNKILPELVAISQKHDLVHLLAVALDKNALVENINHDLSRHILTAVYRYEQKNYELGKICEALEKAEIPFIALKGSVLRKYYPEPWMRTSCDIDILVNKIEVEKAATYLVDNCGYSREGKGSHDIHCLVKIKLISNYIMIW